MNYSKFQILSRFQQIANNQHREDKITLDAGLLIDAYSLILDLLERITPSEPEEADYD